MKKFLMIAVLCIMAASLIAQELEQLQEILKATNATWTARESYVSRMGSLEQEHLLGLLPGIMDIANMPEETILTSREELPRAYETPHTSIKDQGSCGSCYSFGASATYEGFCKKKSGVTYDLSEQDFLMKAKQIGPYGGCSGWYLDTSMNLLKNNGVAEESCCPYKAYETACPATCQPVHKISNWSSTTDVNTIKNALNNYGPVYVGFAVYSDFNYYSTGVYRFASGSLRGYHAVCIVGYDDANQCFKVKNSWGTGWGEAGYFRIGYDQMKNSVQFGTCFGGSFFITAK